MNAKRYEDPKRKTNNREEFKLSLSKTNLERIIWCKRNLNMTINGYDLSKYKRKKETKENLFVLQLNPPLNNPLPNPIAKSVRNLSSEAGSLSWRDDQKNSNHIESLQKENPEKQEKKKVKKKRKRNQLKAHEMNTALKVWIHLMKEEETWNGIDWLKGTQLIEKELPKKKNKYSRPTRTCTMLQLVGMNYSSGAKHNPWQQRIPN